MAWGANQLVTTVRVNITVEPVLINLLLIDVNMDKQMRMHHWSHWLLILCEQLLLCNISYEQEGRSWRFKRVFYSVSFKLSEGSNSALGRSPIKGSLLVVLNVKQRWHLNTQIRVIILAITTLYCPRLQKIWPTMQVLFTDKISGMTVFKE